MSNDLQLNMQLSRKAGRWRCIAANCSPIATLTRFQIERRLNDASGKSVPVLLQLATT
jgi:hypothetical protein